MPDFGVLLPIFAWFWFTFAWFGLLLPDFGLLLPDFGVLSPDFTVLLPDFGGVFKKMFFCYHSICIQINTHKKGRLFAIVEF